MSEQDNVRVVQEAYAAFQRGDVNQVLNSLADDVEWITPGPTEILPTAGTRRGRDAVAQFFSTLAATEDVEMFEPVDFIAQGDKVVSVVNYRGRVKANGRAAESQLVHIFTLRNGRVARFCEFFDTHAAVEAFRPMSRTAGSAT